MLIIIGVIFLCVDHLIIPKKIQGMWLVDLLIHLNYEVWTFNVFNFLTLIVLFECF